MPITQGTKITDGTAQFIIDDITDSIPVGDVAYRPYLKDGYLACNGQTVNRSDYPRLVELADKYSLWTADQSSEPWKFGQGNGSTTMLMPNYKDRVLQGGDTVGTKEAGLPNITGYIAGILVVAKTNQTEGNIKGFFRPMLTDFSSPAMGNAAYQTKTDATRDGSYIRVDASYSNAIYGKSDTVQPPAIVLIPQMKY